MKTCPACHSVAFDDARVCYGCMHPFDRELFGAIREVEENPRASEKPVTHKLESLVMAEHTDEIAVRREERGGTQRSQVVALSGDNTSCSASVLELKIPLLVSGESLASQFDENDAMNAETLPDGWEVKIEVRNTTRSAMHAPAFRRQKKKKTKSRANKGEVDYGTNHEMICV